MTNTSIILKTIALMMAICMLFSAVACSGGGTDVNSDASSDDILYGNAVDDEDEDDVVTNEGGSTGGGSTGGGSTGGSKKPTGTASGAGDIVQGAEKVDEDARQEFLASVPKKFKGSTVKLMVWWTKEYNAWEAAKFEDFTNATGIDIEYVTVTAPTEGDYYTKLNAFIMQKNSPDIACVDGAWFPNAVAANWFQPLSVAKLDLDDPVYDIELMDKYKYNGQYYSAIIKSTCVPAELSCLAYNKDMLKANGIKDDPYALYQKGQWNWDSLISIATEMHKKTGNSSQLCVAYSGRQLALSVGEDVIMLDNGKPTNNFKSETVRSAWQFVSDLKHKYNLTTVNFGPFIDGTASLALTADYNVQSGGYFEQNIGDDFEWGIVPVPSPAGSPTYVPVHVKGYGIPAKAQNPEAAGFVLRYWLDDAMNRPGNPTWTNSEVGDMIHHLWDLPKSPSYSNGVMNYGDSTVGAGKEGRWGDMTGKFSTITAANMATEFDSWSGTADQCIDQILKEAANKK